MKFVKLVPSKIGISWHLLLPTESGGYWKEPRVERLCPFCESSEIGNGFYYLLYLRRLFSSKVYLAEEPLFYKQYLLEYVYQGANFYLLAVSDFF